MTKIRFEEPPDPQQGAPRGSYKYRDAVTQLKKRPGEWAIIAKFSSYPGSNSMASRVKNGNARAFLPKGAFEAVSRNVNGEHRVYARYIGPDGEHR